MSASKSIMSGIVGACVLTAVHETARRVIPHAPRVDVIGMRAIAKPMRAAGLRPPTLGARHQLALAGDLVSNSLYYALVGLGLSAARDDRKIWMRGAALGFLGGLGAVFLPRPLGLGPQPYHRTPVTQVLTVLWYLIGGLAAAATAEWIGDRHEVESPMSHVKRSVQPKRISESLLSVG
jgi:hypothetical protein